MKKTIFQSSFAHHLFDEDTQVLYSYWTSETEYMTETDFRNEMQAWLKASQQCSPQKIFDKCDDFLYPINPAEQIWLAELINVEWIRLGVKKYAHIVPVELIANISTDQLFEEFYAMKLENQFELRNFSDAQEAINWLMN